MEESARGKGLKKTDPGWGIIGVFKHREKMCNLDRGNTGK